MSQGEWDRIKKIFQEVRELDERARAARLEELAAKDPDVAARVHGLLDAESEAEGWLDVATVAGIDAGALVAAGSEAGGEMEGPGSRIGPYKLLQEIGEGGFGVVYMAEQDQPIRRRVALKVVKPGMDTKQVIARFEAERQALAMMDHPNIAKVFDAGATPNGRPYFVMELVKGIPITDYCDEHKLDTRERLALFRDVCGAVDHAHRSGIIHRDLKPSNVMVTLHDGTPVPKVIDFGVAKATRHRLTETTLFTEYHQFIGTPTYMSPEQAAYEGLDVDARSDVYSLGVLLYELLTGTTPHDSRAMKRAAYLEVLRILKEEEPPKPSTRVHTMGRASVTHAQHRGSDPNGLERLLRGDLDWIVMKALEKDRRRRYDSASSLADDIGRYFESRPITARPPSRVYRAHKFARRRRGPLAAAAVMVLAALVDVGYVTVQRSRMAQGVAVAGPAGAQRTALVMASSEHDCSIGAKPSPDGTRIAYTDWCLEGGVHVLDLESGASTTLTSGDQYYQSLVWSPGGAEILTAAWDARALLPRVISMRDGSVRAAVALEGTSIAPHAWSADGVWIAGVDHTPGADALVAVSLESGERVVLAPEARQDQESTLAFSPDGRFVTFSDVSGGSEDLFVADVRTGRRWPLVTAAGSETHALWSPDGTTVLYRNDEGVWAVPVSSGHPSGDPYLVRRDGHVPVAWTSHGYYYKVRNVVGRGHRIAIDAERGAASGGWEPYALPGSDLTFVRMAWSPDGSTAAVAGCCDGQLYLTDGRTSRTIPLGADLTPAKLWWSADGTEVLFSTASQRQRDPSSRTVFAVETRSGRLREVFAPVYGRGLGHPHLSPDGRRMVFVRRRNELVIGEVGQVEGGQVLATRDERGGLSTIYGQPRFSPDGRRVAYLRDRRGPATLWVVDADGSNETLLASSTEEGVISALAWHPEGSLIAYQDWDGADSEGLWVVSLEDGVKWKVSDLAEFDESLLLDWTPDGRSLLLRETTGRDEIWVTDDILGGEGTEE